MPNESQNQKSHEQLVAESLVRRRKPLIDLNKKTETEAIKAKQAEIDNLASQVRKLQEAVTAKESYIRELEDKLANALNPPSPPVVEKTEEIPGTSRRRGRQQVQPEAPKEDPKPEEPAKEPEQLERPAPSSPAAQVAPGDGIVCDGTTLVENVITGDRNTPEQIETADSPSCPL